MQQRSFGIRALHQLYLVFVILGQGKIKSGWKVSKTALEMGPSCSTGAAGAVQSGFRPSFQSLIIAQTSHVLAVLGCSLPQANKGFQITLLKDFSQHCIRVNK